jgi:hypothetical protein
VFNGGLGIGYVPARIITSPPTTRYVVPGGAGAGTGVNIANAYPLSSLNTAMAAAGAGGEVRIINDLGNFTQTSAISISAAGEPGRPIRVVGMNSSLGAGTRADAKIIGNRTAWSLLSEKPTLGNFVDTSGYGGNNLFNFSGAAKWLTFENLYMQNLGNTLNLSNISGAQGITFRDIDAYNVRSWVYTDANSAVNGITVDNCTTLGFSKDSIRFRGTSNGWTVTNCTFDSNWQDADSFATGFRCNESAGNMLVEDCIVRHCIESADFQSGFKNGDGISTEHGNHHFTLRRCTFEDITDAGIDMKGRYVLAEDCDVIGCGWSIKNFFGSTTGNRYVRCRSINPAAFSGDSRSVIHLWSGGNPQIVAPYSYNDDENYAYFEDFQGTGGPTGMTAFVIETSKKHFVFNNNGGVTLTSGSTLQSNAPNGSSFAYNQSF